MLDTELSEESLEQLVKKYKEHVKETTKKDFPQDPYEQLWGAISAVFDSWKNQRAITYRKLNDIPEEWGTAVNIQQWFLEIWEMIVVQVLLLQEILLLEIKKFMENFL